MSVSLSLSIRLSIYPSVRLSALPVCNHNVLIGMCCVPVHVHSILKMSSMSYVNYEVNFLCSATLSPTPQSPSPTSQRQQDSGFVEQLGDVSSEPLVVTNTQSTIEPNKAGHEEPVSGKYPNNLASP